MEIYTLLCSFMLCKNNLRQVALEKTITVTGWNTKIPINLKANAHYLPRTGSPKHQASCTWAPCHTCPHTAGTTPGSCLKSQTTLPGSVSLSLSHTVHKRWFFCHKNHSYFIFEDLNTVRYSISSCVYAQTHTKSYILTAVLSVLLTGK